jgi:hypothetical protein
MMFTLDGTAESALTSDERHAYRKDLNELPRAFPEDTLKRQDAFWQEFRAKAQLSASESGQLILQGPFGNRLVAIGISRDSFVYDNAPFELQRDLLITHLRSALEGGSVPKTSGTDVREDWLLLERIISIQNGQGGLSRRADIGNPSPEKSSD